MLTEDVNVFVTKNGRTEVVPFSEVSKYHKYVVCKDLFFKMLAVFPVDEVPEHLVPCRGVNSLFVHDSDKTIYTPDQWRIIRTKKLKFYDKIGTVDALTIKQESTGEEESFADLQKDYLNNGYLKRAVGSFDEAY